MKAEPVHSQAEHVADRSPTFARGILAGRGGVGSYLKDKTTGEDTEKDDAKVVWCCVGGTLGYTDSSYPPPQIQPSLHVCVHVHAHMYTQTQLHTSRHFMPSSE